MGLLFFFVNKPVTFLMYMLSLSALFILMIFLDGFGAIISFPILILAFSLNYSVYLFWFYFVRNNDENLKIKNVPLPCLKPYFKLFWIIISFFFILFSISPYFIPKFQGEGVISVILFLFLIATFISYITLGKLILVAFLSEGFRNNTDIKNASLENIYVDAREILTKKLIKTDPK